MYTGKYTEEPAQPLDTQGRPNNGANTLFRANNSVDDDELVKDIRVYVTAEFFMLDDLKKLALGRFKSSLEKLWVSELLSDCIREVYASTTESESELRNSVVEVAMTHRIDLWKRKEFRDLIYEGGDFAVDLMGKFCSEHRRSGW